MDTEIINSWVKNLGRTHEELVREGVISNKPLKSLLGDEDEDLIQIPTPGIELWFWAETKRLEKVLIILIQSVEGKAGRLQELSATQLLN